MTRRADAPAPPTSDELHRWGLDPVWSRHVPVGPTGLRWHALDTAPPARTDPPATPDPAHTDRPATQSRSVPVLPAASDTESVGGGSGGRSGAPSVVGSARSVGMPTVVCVHGNPTWSWVWGSFLHRFAADGYRVVAPDLPGMGYSDRPSTARRYADRVADLDDVLAALDVTGPVVLAAHDWGGAIAMGWAVEHLDRVAALVLANTGIAVPEGRRAPGVIRLAATRGVHDLATRRTPLFVRGAGWLSRDRVTATDREALAAPYRRAEYRTAIADFVADIPFIPDHPSAGAIDAVATALGRIDAPVLLLWGGRDPVFDDDFAADLLDRFERPGRRTDLHRFPTAGHLVVPETASADWPGPSAADVAATWLAASLPMSDLDDAAGRPADRAVVDDSVADPADDPVGRGWGDRRSAGAAIAERAGDSGGREVIAFHDGTTGRSITFGELDHVVTSIGARLRERGIGRGDRIAVLVPPSVELIALVYACWRIGAVTVIADRGLGLTGLGRAVRGARVDALVGARRALVAARTLRWAPAAASIDLADLVVPAPTSTSTDTSTDSSPPAGDPGPDELAAVLFTSGATGPAKGVRYTHGRLARQRDALAELYGIGPDDRFVAAFAPFALYGPALGITSAIPDVDVTAPGALTAKALDAACAAIDATMVFASPAALANVVRTATGPASPALAAVRTVMSAGAPVPVRTLRAVAALAPAAELHTPYGMTEVLPVADIELDAIELAGAELADVERADIEASLADGTRVADRAAGGVCVGRPVPGCVVRIAPLDGDGTAAVGPGVTGEVLVAAPWMSAGYDGLWRTEHDARPVDADGREWHRSGDVGHLDADGRLWIEGRVVHVVWTVAGPVTSVPAEVTVESLDDVDRAAVVGVGPAGVQQVVVVLEPAPSVDASRHHRLLRRSLSRLRRRTGRPPARPLADLALADLDLTARVRAALAPVPVAAVCTTGALPVDIRHNAKIDRSAVADRAATLLAGGGST